MAAQVCAGAFLGSARVLQSRTSRTTRAQPVVTAASRTLWLPGIEAPKHLTGKLPGGAARGVGVGHGQPRDGGRLGWAGSSPAALYPLLQMGALIRLGLELTPSA